MSSFRERCPVYFLVLSVFIFCAPMLLHPGLPFGNDLSFHLSRIASLKEAFAAGVFLPGVYSDYFSGMGYGVGLFYPDLFLYIPVALSLLGLKAVTAYKIYLMLLTAAMAWTMYLAVRRMGFSKMAAAISGTVYLFASFHTTDVYIRSSLGEIQAFVFLPLVLAGFADILWGCGNRLGMLVLGYSGLVLSHILTTVVTTLLLVLMTVVFAKQWLREPERFKMLLVAAGFSFFLTAFFTLPMLEQMAFNPIWGDRGLNGHVADWAVPLGQLILAVPRLLGAEGVMPAGVGLSLCVWGVLGLIQKDQRLRGFTICGGLLLWMASKLFPWQIFGGMFQTLQFPWRLYLFVTLFFAMAAGPALLSVFTRKRTVCLAGGALMAVMLATFGAQMTFIYGQYQSVSENPYAAFPAGCEYLPAAMDYGTLMEKSETAKASAWQDGVYHFEITTPGETLPLIYYPGYEASIEKIDDQGNSVRQDLRAGRSAQGFVILEDGVTGRGTLCYRGTPLRQWTRWLSLVSAAVFLIYSNRRRKNNDTKKYFSTD